MDVNEWRLWRHKGIGGSDAPIIMGDSKWATPLELWEQKILDVPPPHEPNFVTDRGDRFEPKIRALYCLMTGVEYEVALLQSQEFSWQKVSLDGISADKKKIIEIKTAGKADQDLVRNGVLPQKYKAQVQHELMVSRAEVCYYLSYNDSEWDEKNVSPSNLEILEVRPDYDYWGVLLSEEQKFWDLVQKKKPPMPCDRDFKTVKGFDEIANKWKRLKLASVRIAEELDAAREELIAIAKDSKHPRCLISGVQVAQVSKIGNINYKAIPQLKGVDLDQYRGKGSISYRVGESNEE